MGTNPTAGWVREDSTRVGVGRRLRILRSDPSPPLPRHSLFLSFFGPIEKNSSFMRSLSGSGYGTVAAGNHKDR